MKNTKSILTCSIVTMLFSLSSCNKVDVKEDERQIRELWAKTSEYLCNGDWENYSKSWDHSSKIQLLHPDGGEWLTGWAKISPAYKTRLNSGMRCSLPKNDLTVNIAKSGDMAWVTADIIVQYSDSINRQVHLWDLGIFEKIDGHWKMVSVMASAPKNVKE